MFIKAELAMDFVVSRVVVKLDAADPAFGTVKVPVTVFGLAHARLRSISLLPHRL